MGISNKLSWHLKIYPYGYEEKDNGNVSIFLQSENDFTVKVLYELNIKDITNVDKKLEHIFKPNSSAYGYFKITERNYVINKLKQLSRSFTVTCEFHNVTIIKNSYDSPIDNSKLEVLNDIGQLFMNKDFYDITIKTNTKEFQAHKLMLSARSKVFAAMFNHEMIEKIKNIVEIKDIDCQVVEIMLKFIYTGEVNITERIAKELLTAADKYAIDGLKNICISKLDKTMNVDNAIDLLLFANLYNLNEFKKSVVNFIVANAKDIIHKPEFNLLKDIPDILIELFSQLTLNPDKNC